MSLDTLETSQSLRDCEFTDEQATLLARLLVERDEDLVKKEELDRRLLESDHKVDNLQRDMENGFAQVQESFARMQAEMERGFAQLRAEMERDREQLRLEMERDREQLRAEMEQLRLEMRRDLELSQAEQRRHTEQVASEARQHADRIERNTLVAMIVVAGVVIAAVGLIVALV